MIQHFLSYLDITRRVEAEQQVRAHAAELEERVEERTRTLAESEARLRGVLDGMGEGFGVIGPDFTILEHNREALRMDGRPKAEIVGRSHWDAFPGTEHSEVGLLLKRAMTDRRPAFLEHRYAWEGGRALWLELRVYPIADGALAAFWRDVTARKLAEEARRESESRFAQFAAGTTDVLWIRDADTMTLEYISPAFESVFGVTPGSVDGGIEPGAALVDPADRERVMEHLGAARRGEPQVYEFRIAHGIDGGLRWIRDHCFPLIDGVGRVERIGGIARDVTELKLAELALRESEERLAAAFESVPAGVAVIDLAGKLVVANAEFRRFLPSGIVPSRDPERGHRWRAWDEAGQPIAPQDFPTARALRGESVIPGLEMLYTDHEGRDIWTIVATSPTFDEAGRVTGAVSTIGDIDQRKRAEAHQQTLLAELQHRVRNTLGIVRSIARRTAQKSESVEELSAHLDGRIEAFARVQAAVTRNPTGGVDLAGLIEDELVAHATREGEAVTLDGPDVTLAVRPAETLSLAFHELVTNAVKYGALGSQQGRIAIGWTLADGRLEFSWRESGAPPPAAKVEREGFGFELLRRVIPYELSARTAVEFRPDGLHFTLSMPAEGNLQAP